MAGGASIPGVAESAGAKRSSVNAETLVLALRHTTHPPQSHAAHCTAPFAVVKTRVSKRLFSSAEQVPAAQPLLVTHEGAKLQHASCTVNLIASGWAIRRRQIPSPRQRPCQSFTGGARTRRDPVDEAGPALEQKDGVIQCRPGRCIGLGKLRHSNGSGRGRHVERGPVCSCDIENMGREKSTCRSPRTRPAGRAEADRSRRRPLRNFQLGMSSIVTLRARIAMPARKKLVGR